jgi:hypothetical protein
MLIEIFLFLFTDANARPPDVTLEVVPRAGSTLTGRVTPSGQDVLLWIEEDTERARMGAWAGATVAVDTVAEDVKALVGIVDFDQDGVGNILGYDSSYDLVDLATGAAVGLELDCIGAIVGDVDGDGAGDFATPSSVWLGQPGGFGPGATLYSSQDTVDCPTIVAVGDLDGDGRGDLVRSNVNVGAPFSYDTVSSPLDLYLGSTYGEPAWSPRWAHTHPTYPAGRDPSAEVGGQEVLSG